MTFLTSTAPRFYVYVVVDVADTVKAVAVRLSRREARDFIAEQPDTTNLRVRRARVTLYER